MTPIADMVERMLAADVPHALIVEAIRVAETVTALPVTQRSRKAINQANYRAKLKQKQDASVAMAAAPEPVTPGNAGGNAVTSVSDIKEGVLSIEKELESKKEKKKEVVARARGKRLADDWKPSEIDLDFARAHNLRGADLDNEVTKFRNYWTNRTDHQASKPRWDRAWENWVLNVRKPGNGKRTVQDAAADLVERTRAGGIRDRTGETNVWLLPPGRR